MTYYHGIRVEEQATSIIAPITSTAGLQVVVGTAPVNLAKDPYSVTNTPLIAYSFAEAVSKLGYSDDFKKYTLCQSMDASFRVFNVAPSVFINVLDPKKHKKDNPEGPINVVAKQAKIETAGVLLDTLVVKNGSAILKKDVDYIATFSEDGSVLISLIEGSTHASASSLTVKSTSIDPTAVRAKDVVGGYDAATDKETGIELIRQVYPKFGLVPGLLLAPGWSHIPEVGVVLGAKCTEINGVFSCECVIDVDCTSTGAKKYTDVGTWKKQHGYTNKHSVVLWPQIKVGAKQYAYSAIFAALVAYTDATNDDVPNLSPSNKLIEISGMVLDDGTEVVLDQDQAGALNGEGIVTAINVGGWRSWGNNTAAYPGITDPKDRWFCCRRFFSWWSNSFILTYFHKVDDPANYRLIESIVDSENIRGNSYVSQSKCAGAKIVFDEKDNQITDILNGKIKFHQYLAPYVPAENIVNVLEFDPTMLATALNGGGN